jgi:hypothetical protein
MNLYAILLPKNENLCLKKVADLSSLYYLLIMLRLVRRLNYFASIRDRIKQ